jgi:hypothetical protein
MALSNRDLSFPSAVEDVPIVGSGWRFFESTSVNRSSFEADAAECGRRAPSSCTEVRCKEVVRLLVPSLCRFFSTTIRNFFSKARFRRSTTKALTKIADPIMIKTKSMICWKVLMMLRLMEPRPERVIALTTRNSASMYLTFPDGVLAPQKITDAIMHVTIM